MSEPEEMPIPERPPPAALAKRTRRRRRRRPLLLRYWWLIPIAALAILIPKAVIWLGNPHLRHAPLEGYISDPARIETEYLNLTGQPPDPAATHDFDEATRLMNEGKYPNAAILLDRMSRQVPVPAVFNDLGLLYAKSSDGTHALKAFRDALARDHDYGPARANMKRLRLTDSADPLNTEIEPNNTNLEANAVWLDRPITGEISPGVGDVDCYWFITPRPPRDRISILVAPQTSTLTLRLRIYNESGSVIAGLQDAPSPGQPVRYDFSAPPNALYYVQVQGVSTSSGAYVLTVSAMHAYDVYEPNDTLLTATRILPGQTVEANIMDDDDTDYYSFQSSAAGSVEVDLTPGSDSLELGLSSFAPDLHNTGFAPEPKGPGQRIHYSLKVEPNQSYYVQVFSQNHASGPYTLVIK